MASHRDLFSARFSLLFYINDLPDYLEQCKVSLYADDTAMYFASRPQVDIMLTLRLELSTVSEWSKANRLTLNVNKTNGQPSE